MVDSVGNCLVENDENDMVWYIAEVLHQQR